MVEKTETTLYALGDTNMADTHSLDIVCKVEMHEVKNAVDQAKKQLAVRYDFKGSKSTITLNKDDTITLIACITACRSSIFFPDTLILSSWICDCTFIFMPLISLMIPFALSIGMPD